ncbi:MAG TPA: peptide chain release factor N(5)-glutamine methyltransferase [Bacillales bacterium]|nr:peptide chain release factor N(5)-glutamine methyltransferase [Bacillales bacterium]
MQVHEALKRASSFLKERGREPRAAEILLRHHLAVSRTKLFQIMRDDLPDETDASFMEDVEAHAKGAPVQHLTGIEEFYGRTFKVNENVLIPRPETEELVAAVLKKAANHFPGEEDLRVVDVGTGSGAIAVTLALENPRLSVSAIDISDAALSTAEENADLLGAHVTFYQGDLLGPFIESGLKADVIVANPPYISEADIDLLDPLVKDKEPYVALSGGIDGYVIYKRLVAQIPNVLHGKGLIAFEVGVGQSRKVASLLRAKLPDRAEISINHDINGKDRMVIAVL